MRVVNLLQWLCTHHKPTSVTHRHTKLAELKGKLNYAAMAV